MQVPSVIGRTAQLKRATKNGERTTEEAAEMTAGIGAGKIHPAIATILVEGLPIETVATEHRTGTARSELHLGLGRLLLHGIVGEGRGHVAGSVLKGKESVFDYVLVF